ncbi:GNAT family N-acetyltransferase [Halobacteriovorax sp. GB3]|uniref:GNAT family N-acetyltransferase n=1 Tax=Halobacteriovorax sp. GB3 TaxID=2719615 RepID=UPI002360C01C|nr:GNAT family N-acetyltransferase [Halobacteriovorax sp. GB3]MDD0851918.1 GNAT family N-acetyltransferase [Halobacteriovorax sp. GB3]
MNNIEKITIKNGETVTIRQVIPEDKELFIKGFKMLSEQTKRFRFMSAKKELADKEAEFYAKPDGKNHLAISAGIETEQKQLGIGVARIVRESEGSDTGEFAIVLVDSYQQMGIGKHLLTRLFKDSLAVGITKVIGTMRVENKGMELLLKKFKGFQFHHAGSGLMEIHGDLEKALL